MSHCINRNIGHHVAAEFPAFYILKLFLVFNMKNKINLLKFPNIFRIVQVIVHIIHKTVNSNKWRWNECQEILQSVWLS